MLAAPLGVLPLLLRDGGIVPMLDASIDTLAPATEPGIVTLDHVKDRLDVMVALSPGREAKITLADSTELTARRGAMSGPPSGLPEVPPETLAACDGGCVNMIAEAASDRLRLTTPLVAEHAVTHGDVTLEARGPLARRVRWDVRLFR